MTIPAAGPGPQCETCQAEPAIISLMQLADWSQLRIGANCAPEVLRGFADTMDGRLTALPPETSAMDECPVCGAMIADSEIEQHLAIHADQQPDTLDALTDDQRQAVLAAMDPADAEAIRTIPAKAEGMEIQLPSGQVITWAEWLALGGQVEPGATAAGEPDQQHWSGAGKVVRSTHGHRKPKGGPASDKPASDDTDQG